MAKKYLCLCHVVVVFSATLASQAKAFTNPLEAQQRKSRGLEGKEEGEEEEEERQGEMVRLGRKCRNINIGTRMAGTMFIFHVYKLYILLLVVQTWSACSIQLSTLSMVNTSRCFSPLFFGFASIYLYV